MPKVSRESATGGGDFGPVLDAHEELGDWTINFVTFREDVDATPMLRGLKDDRCQCPHWGYVFKGRLVYRFEDHEEVVEAGEAFYLPPGHIPVANAPGTELVQFSPSRELAETDAVMMRNLAAVGAHAPS